MKENKTIEDILKDFDEKFDSRYSPPDYRGLKMTDEAYDFNCEFHNDQKKYIKDFIKSSIKQSIESIKPEMIDIDETGIYDADLEAKLFMRGYEKCLSQLEANKDKYFSKL